MNMGVTLQSGAGPLPYGAGMSTSATPMGGSMGQVGMGGPGGAGNLVKDGLQSVFDNYQVANGILTVINKPPIPTSAMAGSALSPTFGGITQVAEGVAKGGLFGGIGEGLVSAVFNGLAVFKHEETVPQAGGAVAADTASGAVAGLASATVSGTALALLSGFAGLAGAPLMLIGGAIGLGVFYLADHVFKRSSLYSEIKSKVSAALAGITHQTA